MFKYKAKEKILRDMQVQKTGRYWDKEYFKLEDILNDFNVFRDKSSALTLNCVFKRNYPEVEFYSKNKLKLIPVCGYLFPVEMFDEDVVE